jgi:hypothetical protein
MLVGDARVATAEQTLALQEDALRAAGGERLFTDTMSGAQAERPGLAAALAYLRPGDTLAIWRLDWPGRWYRGHDDGYISLPGITTTFGSSYSSDASPLPASAVCRPAGGKRFERELASAMRGAGARLRR